LFCFTVAEHLGHFITPILPMNYATPSNGGCGVVTLFLKSRDVVAKSGLCDDREAYPKGKQSPKGQFCPLSGRLLRQRTPRSDMIPDFKKVLPPPSLSLRAARHAALAAGSGGDREAYPKGKQSPYRPGDCFPRATLHHAPLVAGGTCATLAMTRGRGFFIACNRFLKIRHLSANFLNEGNITPPGYEILTPLQKP
jgi:hypothetical protein